MKKGVTRVLLHQTRKTVMKGINLKKIIDNCGLETKWLASQLFPENKHAGLALDRILKGDAVLDANQIAKLSVLTEIPIGQLFTGEAWKGEVKKAGTYTLSSADYRAELDLDRGTAKLFHKDSVFHELVIMGKGITLSKFIALLDSEILKYQFKNEKIKNRNRN